MPSFFVKTSGGTAASHPASPRRVLYAAPTDAQDHTTIRLDLFPIACWCAGDVRFAFDSSLIKPELAEELARLDALRRSHPRAPLSIFGHADPVGEDAYNKSLSGRRATAIYALLTRRVDLWEALYAAPFGGDIWGPRSLELMLATIKDPQAADSASPEGARPSLEGPSPGARSGREANAIRRFQRDKGLAVDGIAGPITRRALFLAYMDALCRGEDGLPYALDPAEDFLGRGSDSGGKGDYQGCGELNPTLVLSAAEREELAEPEHRALRDVENAPNRRVIAFLFRPGARVSPARWPCPRAGESDAACKARLWSDEGARRAPGDTRRTYRETRDTFACRFYDRLAGASPCEGMPRADVERLIVTILDARRRPQPGLSVVLCAGGERVFGTTDAHGRVEAFVPKGASEAELVLPEQTLVLLLRDLAPITSASGVTERLVNLAYECGSDSLAVDEGTGAALRAFQHDQGLEATGQADAPTRARLKEVYGH